MIVCQLTSVHPAHDTRIFLKECKSLQASGLDVTLIAPDAGKGAPGEIRFVGGPSAGSRFGRMFYSAFVYPWLALRTKAMVIHFHDPELLLGGVGLRLLGRQVIYDVHEDVPADVHDKEWIPALVRKPLAFAVDIMERTAACCMTRVVVATPSIGRRFKPERVTLVQNFPLQSEIKAISQGNVTYVQRDPRFVYIGSITEVRGAHGMLDALQLLGPSSGARLALGGEIWPDSLDRDMKLSPAWHYVDWLGWCDRRKMLEELGKARAGLVLFLPARNHIEAQPNKLFEYMGAGIPVIASDFPLWREIINTAQCGLLVDPSRPADIAAAMKWILDNPGEAAEMGRRGREAVLSRFNWEKEAESLIGMYTALDPGRVSL